MKKAPVRVTITGAAGQIGYATLFRVANGAMLGYDQPIILQLLDLPQAQAALQGVKMELEDCAFPLLEQIITTDDPKVAFKDSDFALMIGARPRSKGMERKDLIEANGAIFSVQGKIINDYASRNIKVLMVGNPANTNALITMKNAPDIDPRNFTAMTRLDHNRAIAQVALKLSQANRDVSKMIIWGNHSSTQFPDLSHAQVGGRSVSDLLTDKEWVGREFIPVVQKRGAAVIEARGLSSAASAANAAIAHMHDWVLGTQPGDWVSMAIPSDGSYGIPEGVIYSYPVTCSNGKYEIVQGLTTTEQDRKLMQVSLEELHEERAVVAGLLG